MWECPFLPPMSLLCDGAIPGRGAAGSFRSSLRDPRRRFSDVEPRRRRRRTSLPPSLLLSCGAAVSSAPGDDKVQEEEFLLLGDGHTHTLTYSGTKKRVHTTSRLQVADPRLVPPSKSKAKQFPRRVRTIRRHQQRCCRRRRRRRSRS